MRINKLIVVVLSLGLISSVPAMADVVTSGLIGAHDAGAGWDGTNWSDQVTGDGYDATGTIYGTDSGVTHTAASGGKPAHFSFATKDFDRIMFDVAPTVLGTSDFTVQIWLKVNSDPIDEGHMGLFGGPGSGAYWKIPQVNDGFGISQVQRGNDMWDGSLFP